MSIDQRTVTEQTMTTVSLITGFAKYEPMRYNSGVKGTDQQSTKLEPSMNSKGTDFVIKAGSTFAFTERLKKTDGVLGFDIYFYKLFDGVGWVHDYVKSERRSRGERHRRSIRIVDADYHIQNWAHLDYKELSRLIHSVKAAGFASNRWGHWEHYLKKKIILEISESLTSGDVKRLGLLLGSVPDELSQDITVTNAKALVSKMRSNAAGELASKRNAAMVELNVSILEPEKDSSAFIRSITLSIPFISFEARAISMSRYKALFQLKDTKFIHHNEIERPVSFSCCSNFIDLARNKSPAKNDYKYWGGSDKPWRNGTTNEPILDLSIIKEEEVFRRSAEIEDLKANENAESLRSRGVSVSFLLCLTNELKIWDWETWEVVQFLVKPATEGRRCRFADLDSVKPFCGPAAVFISHCWSAKWGDLVAAACSGSRTDRFVWVDIFAVRQWPGNVADLNFRGVIAECTALVVAATPQAVPSVDSQKVREEYLQSEDYKVSCKILPFLRLWCLVEIHAAAECGLPIIFRCVKAELTNENIVVTSNDVAQMLSRLILLVDVRHAECAVQADRDREFDFIGRDKLLGLNTVIYQAMNMGESSSLSGDAWMTNAYLCGEPEALFTSADEYSAEAQELLPAAASGNITALCTILSLSQHEHDLSEAFIAASKSAQVAVVEFLLRVGGFDIDFQDPRTHCTALCHAAGLGYLSVAKILVRSGASLSIQDGIGFTPLHGAIASTYWGLAEYLLSVGSNVNIASKNGEHLLMTAVLKNAPYNIIEALCLAGANVNCRYISDTHEMLMMPVHEAARHGRLDVLELMVKYGGLLEVHQQGNTLAHIAANSGHSHILKYLGENGLNLDEPDSMGYRPIDVAEEEGYTDSADILREFVSFFALPTVRMLTPHGKY